MLDFEIEAHACLINDLEKIVSSHPKGEYEVHLTNLEVSRGVDRPLLSVQMLLFAAEDESAKRIGITKMKEFLHYLTLITNFPFKIHKLIRIVDWSPGLMERQCVQFERFPGHDRPHPVLKKEHFKSIETLMRADLDVGCKRALRWFSSGVCAESPDDQFQCFWFVLELLAQRHKGVTKVSDLCPKCKEPLYCESCKTHPSHRPYPQASH